VTTALLIAFAALALLFGVLVAALRHPLYAALSLLGVIGCLSVIFYLLGATFLAMVQLIVYAGATLVLFLFVIMLLDLRGEAREAERHPVQKGLGILLFVNMLLFFVVGAGTLLLKELPPAGRLVRPGVEDLGRLLFTRYLLPFEAVTLLLLAAAVGAFVLARREWK
jgi:NADH-quinone oxidoreductase subunit J